MNQTSPAYDTGLAYHCAKDLAFMKQGQTPLYRRNWLASVFNLPLSVSNWPAIPTCPEHTIFTTVDTMFIAIGGATVWTQIDDFFRKSSVRARNGLDYFNEGTYDVAKVVQLHADSIMPNPLRQVVYGYSFGGAVAQVLALTQDFQFTNGYSAACLTFGSPRTWQDFGGDFNPLGWSLARYMARNDPIVHYVPHANEAPFATALTTNQIAHIWAHTEHVGQGYVIWGGGNIVPQTVPSLSQPIADGFLWSWLLNFNEVQTEGHAIQTYVDFLLSLNEDVYTRSLTPLGANPVIQPAPHEPPGNIMQPLERAALVQQAIQNVVNERGPMPEQKPFYAVRRAGVWVCENEGNFVAGGKGKRSAQAMARRLNAAWVQWWKEPLASAGNLQFAVDQYFPS